MATPVALLMCCLCPFQRYFEGGVSSVYLWDLDHGFAGVILIKKGEQPPCCEQPFFRKAVHAY